MNLEIYSKQSISVRDKLYSGIPKILSSSFLVSYSFLGEERWKKDMRDSEERKQNDSQWNHKNPVQAPKCPRKKHRSLMQH
jgi:hypothetical protein